jgi:hypothetical protein
MKKNSQARSDSVDADQGEPIPGSPSAVDGKSTPLADFDFLSSPEFEVSTEVGEKLALFEGIVEPTPQQMSATRQINSLRVMSLNQPEGQMRRGARYLHASGAGKSTCAKIIKQHVAKLYGFDPDRKSVLHVTLSTTGTPRSLGSSILTEVGEGYSSTGDAELLLLRVREAIKEFNVELIIIDELNHIKGKSLATDAANTIKNILTKGWAPVILMGTIDAEPLVKSNRELKVRCQSQKFLRPYVHTDTTDLKHWSVLMERIDLQMKKRDVVAHTAGLKDMAKELCEASNGLIGEFHGIMLSALEATLNAGEEYVSRSRLSDAVDEWAVSDGTIDINPFMTTTATKPPAKPKKRQAVAVANDDVDGDGE